ncbi:unnamed protein product [Penicillium egyptiacum]|uniref:Protein kinase domain-containing protein n=1 Tax=Penicillium egyptiacum TaxID=1303716 RepID=A0A9W4P9L6_9EURO|nr:unnamed protein product [Penicillium egyptiacum]
MESPRELLARELPDLIKLGVTTSPSVSDETLCATYMHLWTNFKTQVREAVASLDFTGLVSLTDAVEGDFYFVGSELGLTTRFARHVCEPVSKALSVTNVPLQFGDLQALRPNPTIVPDVTLAIFRHGTPPSAGTATLIAAGELKTWWTVDLEHHTVIDPVDVRNYLEPFIGQVVAYMRKSKLRYGFLSTYMSTVFVKREADFCFHLSPPIPHNASAPSLRQCFAGFAVLAAQSPHYEESDSLDAGLLRSSTVPGLIASTRPSMYRSRVGDYIRSLTSVPGISADTIIIGDNGVASGFVNCLKLLSPPRLCHTKAVFELQSGETQYIAKCWSHDQVQSALSEYRVYERLRQLQPNGHDLFTCPAFFGDIICSSQFPQGSILLLEKVPGDQLFGIWKSLSGGEQAHIYNECISGIRIMRSISIRLLDAGKHNILYDRETGKVTLHDFEAVVELDPSAQYTSPHPELGAIFGATEMSGLIHDG